MSDLGVRRAKTAFFSGCQSHSAIAPAGSNRSNRACPVITHTHYMLGVHSNGRRGRILDVVGVGENRTGTGAIMEVTKWLKPSDSVSRMGEPRLPLWVQAV